MNLVLLGGAAVPVAWLGGGFVYFFIPPSGGGGGGGLVARDANGDEVTKDGWGKLHGAGDRSLVQGLKGDAHYLITEGDGSIRNYALNAVCTHLGCVVPWNRAANKFMCPCHGSQYDQTGKVVRGPAPLSLALAHLDINDGGKVVLSPWTETDFRTDLPPWWKA
jgi:cytochrome b6-f complex iron-sulfur subunit